MIPKKGTRGTCETMSYLASIESILWCGFVSKSRCDEDPSLGYKFDINQKPKNLVLTLDPNLRQEVVPIFRLIGQ